MKSLPKRSRSPVPGAILALGLLLGGCAGAPAPDPVPQENAQQRMLQQTISQLRKNMDDIRLQREVVQEQYYKAERELETAHRENSFLESRVRVERELADSRSAQLGDLQNQHLQTTTELRQAKERIARLERDQTSIRAAFDQDQMKVAQLENEAVARAGELDALKSKLAGATEAWELERRSLRDTLQTRDDEIAVLRGKLAQSEADARTAIAAAPGRTAGAGTGNAPAAAARTGSTPAPAARTSIPGPETAPPATAAAGDDGAGDAAATPLWERKAKEAFATTMTRFGQFISNPAGNWRALAHPAPILFVFFAGVMPLLMFFSVRRRLRRRAVRRHAQRVAQAAQLAHDVAPAPHSAPSARPARAMPSVAIPRRREVIPTVTSPAPAAPRAAEPISPHSASSVAATLDAVLGGDPISTPPAKRPGPGGKGDDEDDLLGDLRSIVQKGLS